jgi:hypothetical protein
MDNENTPPTPGDFGIKYLVLKTENMREPSNLELASFISLQQAMYFYAQQVIDINADLLSEDSELEQAIAMSVSAVKDVQDWWIALVDPSVQADLFKDKPDDSECAGW